MCLSAREVDVLRCLATGHDSNKAAARVLGVQPFTIKDYLRILYRKLAPLRRAAVQTVGAKDWARRILTRAEAGERIRPICLRFAQEALKGDVA